MHAWKVLCENKGGVAILVGVSLVVFLSMAAFAVDYGFGLVARNELKNVADAAALAGTRCLGAIYAGGTHPCASSIAGLTPTQQQNYVLSSTDRAAIVAQVQNVAQKNTAGGKSITIANADISIGQWDLKAQSLTVTDTRPTAVEVTARRDGVENGPISTFFANIMGITTANVTSTSVNTVSATVMHPTAALTSVSHVEPGGVDIPVALSQSRFSGGKGAFCGEVIKFSPTTDPNACDGWTLLTTDSPNDKDIRTLLNNLYKDPSSTPALSVGDSIYVKNGDLSNPTFDALNALYKKNAVDGTWKAFLPVYDNDICNPKSVYHVAGFATVLITTVDVKTKEISGTVLCDVVEPDARGGGAEFGTLGAIPGLVQ